MLVLNISHLVKDTMRVTAIVIYILITVAKSELTRKVKVPLCTSETVNMYRISDPGSCKSGNNATRYVHNI